MARPTGALGSSRPCWGSAICGSRGCGRSSSRRETASAGGFAILFKRHLDKRLLRHGVRVQFSAARPLAHREWRIIQIFLRCIPCHSMNTSVRCAPPARRDAHPLPLALLPITETRCRPARQQGSAPQQSGWRQRNRNSIQRTDGANGPSVRLNRCTATIAPPAAINSWVIHRSSRSVFEISLTQNQKSRPVRA